MEEPVLRQKTWMDTELTNQTLRDCNSFVLSLLYSLIGQVPKELQSKFGRPALSHATLSSLTLKTCQTPEDLAVPSLSCVCTQQLKAFFSKSQCHSFVSHVNQPCAVTLSYFPGCYNQNYLVITMNPWKKETVY